MSRLSATKLVIARDFLLADLPAAADLAPVDVAAISHVVAILDKLSDEENQREADACNYDLTDADVRGLMY
jgi:hypothetical protein